MRPWQEILPGIYKMLAISRQSNWITYLLIYLVAAIGLLNTQRMSALERKREFGVLMAIGMRPRRMFRMILTESLVLGTLGGLVGTALGMAVTWYHATRGLDLGMFTRHGEFTFMGVSFTGRIYSILTPTAALQPILVMVFVAFLAGLWPAAEVGQAGSCSHHCGEAMMLWRIAWRNLWRHRTRTLIMASAVAFSYGLALFSMGIGDDGHQQMLEQAAQGAGGDILVHAKGYWESQSNDLVMQNGDAVLAEVRVRRRGSGRHPPAHPQRPGQQRVREPARRSQGNRARSGAGAEGLSPATCRRERSWPPRTGAIPSSWGR